MTVNNLRLKTLGSRTVNIDYSPTTNLVTQAKDSANGNTWKTYTHDARGNVTSNGDINFVYDHANQPQSISGAASGAYIYDGNLKRVKQDVEGKKVYSVYSSLGGGISHRYEVGVDPVTLLPDADNDVRTDFVSLGGTTIRLQKTGTASETAVYTHSDHQGSPVVATKADGSIDWREAYTPFGEKLIDPAANRDMSGYTGHIADDATNLVYMQARYYDPAIGRFLSTDPIGYQDQINQFAYVRNDPIGNIDPTGMATTGTRIKEKAPPDMPSGTSGGGFDATLGDLGSMGMAPAEPAPVQCAGACSIPENSSAAPNGRPYSDEFMDNYLNYDDNSSTDVWNKIGGSLGKEYAGSNSCAARVSCGLNASGAEIPSVDGASNLVFGGPNDGVRIIISARQLRNYIGSEWGTADYTNASVYTVQQSLQPGQAAIYLSDGHAGAVTKNYSDRFTNFGDFWVLPVK